MNSFRRNIMLANSMISNEGGGEKVYNKLSVSINRLDIITVEFQYPVESDVEISYHIYGGVNSIIIYKGTTRGSINNYYWMDNVNDIIASITPSEDETYIYGL